MAETANYGNGLSKCDRLIVGRSDIIEVKLIVINDIHYWLEQVGGSMRYINIEMHQVGVHISLLPSVVLTLRGCARHIDDIIGDIIDDIIGDCLLMEIFTVLEF